MSKKNSSKWRKNSPVGDGRNAAVGVSEYNGDPEEDREDNTETVEVNLKEAGLMPSSAEELHRRVEATERLVRELSDKISDLLDENQEIFRRISLSIGDSQLAIKNSDHSLKEMKQIKKENQQYIDDINRKMEAFTEAFNKNIEELAQKMEEYRSSLFSSVDSIKGEISLKSSVGVSAGVDEDLLKNKLEGIKSDLEEKIESSEDRLEKVKGVLTENINSLEVRFKSIIEDLNEKICNFQEKIKDIPSTPVAGQEQINAVMEKLSLLEAKMQENSDYIDLVEKTMESLKERAGSFDDEKLQKMNEKINSISENLRLEMEVFSDGLKTLLKNEIENVEKKAGEAIERVSEISGRFDGLFEERVRAIDVKLEEVKSRIENDVLSKIEPLEKKLSSISGDLEEKLSPIRSEVDEAKSFIEKEMIKLKESWDKLDKTISDSNGAMEIAQRAKESLERMEKEVNEALGRIDGMIAQIKENTLKTDANSDKINLTIKLIDEAREKIKGIQVPVMAGASVMPTATSAAVEISDMDLVLTPKEILEPPDTSDIGFDLDDLLQVMIKHEASDLHLKSGSPPTVRLEGELIPVGNQILNDTACKKLILSAMNPAQRRQLAMKHEVDFAYAIPEARFRVNAFLQKQSISAAFRLLRTEIPTIEDLNLPVVLKKLCDYNHGLILVTGPAGCGKSTTLSAMINYINETKKMHIVTIEDPIEFVHNDKMSIITQREIGTDTESFPVALKQSLRQDPNVILIGEMRDPETIMTAVVAAETGHLVLSTLHTPNTIQAINRIIDVFSGDLQKQFRLLLSTTLRGIISQRLLTRSDESGRIPAVEVLMVTPTISSLILEERVSDIYQHMVQGATEGMQTFTQSLMNLYEQGLITKEEALYHADQPTEFRLAIEGHSTGTTTMHEDSLMSWL